MLSETAALSCCCSMNYSNSCLVGNKKKKKRGWKLLSFARQMIAILALEKMRKAFKLSNLTGKERVLCFVRVRNLFTERRPGRFHEALWCNDGKGRVMEMLFWQQTLNGKELVCRGLVWVWKKLNLFLDIRYRDKCNELNRKNDAKQQSTARSPLIVSLVGIA